MGLNPLYNEFVQASKEAASDLGFNPDNVKFSHDETPEIGIDYSAEIHENGRWFGFYISTDTENQNPTKGIMTASMTIKYKEELSSYNFYELFKTKKERPHSLSRWASWAIFNFREKHDKTNLKSLFSDIDIRVYGVPGYCSDEEAELVLNGILNTSHDKIIIYKFQHIREEDHYRSLSYAILVAPKKSLHRFWIVFPENCGLDSGGARKSYKKFENLIEQLKSNYKVELKKYDIRYSEFENFLLGKSSSFVSGFREEIFNPYNFSSYCPIILEREEKEFNEAVESFQKKEYSKTLQKLRVLVQQAQENLLELKSPKCEIPANASINKLAEKLIKEKVIDGRLNFWFKSFASIANPPSHKCNPYKKEKVKNSIFIRRIILGIYLGFQLIEELSEAGYPRTSLWDTE